jgi:glycosyltransferase involved in cell wall biosynthesis
MNLSINVTCFNKDFLIKDVLDRIKLHTTGSYELIVMLDSCTDRSEEIVLKWFKDNDDVSGFPLWGNDLYECKANNMTMKASTGDYIILVQDDQIIRQGAFNEHLIKPFLLYDDVLCVTGRAAHNYIVDARSTDLYTDEIRNDRWCNILHICDMANNNQATDIFAIRNSCNRGPYMVDHAKIEKLGYFDEAFLMDGEEHDLCYRGRKEYGWVSGSRWINWSGDTRHGGTRDPITGETKSWMYENSFKSQELFYSKHKYAINNRIVEERPCP